MKLHELGREGRIKVLKKEEFKIIKGIKRIGNRGEKRKRSYVSIYTITVKYRDT